MRINFKDPATAAAVMEGIIDFHHDIQIYLIIIVTFVAWMLFSVVYEFGIMKNIKEERNDKENEKERLLKRRKESLITKGVTYGVMIEIVWTICSAVLDIGEFLISRSETPMAGSGAGGGAGGPNSGDPDPKDPDDWKNKLKKYAVYGAAVLLGFVVGVGTYYLYQQCGADGDINGGVNGSTGNSEGTPTTSSTVTGLNNTATAELVIGAIVIKNGIDVFNETGSNLITADTILIQDELRNQELVNCSKQLQHLLGMSNTLPRLEQELLNVAQDGFRYMALYLKYVNDFDMGIPSLCEESGLQGLDSMTLTEVEIISWKTTGVPLEQYERILHLIKVYTEYYIKLGGNAEYLNNYMGDLEEILNKKRG
jgi:hypothetical protein